MFLRFLLIALFAAASHLFAQTVTFGTEYEQETFGAATPLFIGQTSSAYYVVRLEGLTAANSQYGLLSDNPASGMALSMLVGIGVINDDRRLNDLDSYLSTPNASMFTSTKPMLEKYDLTGKRVWSRLIETKFEDKKEDKKFVLKKIALIGEKILVVATSYNDDNKSCGLYATWATADGFVDLSKAKKLDDVVGKNSAFAKSNNSYRIITGLEDGKFAEYYWLNAEEGGSPTSLGVVVYNNDFTESWRGTFPMQYTEKKVRIATAIADKAGNLYILARIFASSDDKKEGAKNFRYELLKASAGAKTFKALKIEVAGKMVPDLQMQWEADGKLIISGFYSEKSAKSAGGAFLYRVDPASFAYVHQKVTAFTSAHAAAIVGEADDDDEPEISNLHLRNIYKNTDGSYTLIGEMYTILTSYSNGGWSFSYRYTNIVAIRMTDDGVFRWITAVVKKQKSTNDGARFLSYTSQQVGDNIYLIFNGNKKDVTKAMLNPEQANAYAATLDANGKMTLKTLFNANEEDTKMLPKASFLLDNGKIVTYNIDGKQFRFGFIKL